MIIDHSSVALYSQIPSQYIDEIKKMWINIPGESHSMGYRIGLQLLSNAEATYSASITEAGSPEAYREDALRTSRFRRTISTWITTTGEEHWFTNATGIQGIKDHIDYCENNDLHISAIGFGWCWDMTQTNGPTDDSDPVHKCHWYGTSVGGPDGNLEWGLDSDDYAITDNTVCMDTYLSAVAEYISHCINEANETVVFFTTGPVDGYVGEAYKETAYQRHVKHEYIRQYVSSNSSCVLFDYADILAWSNAGEENIQTWDDPEEIEHNYQMIHSDNMLDLGGGYEEDGDHIGERGALRLGKALWVMLAYLAGWDGPAANRSRHPRYSRRVIV